MKPFKEADGYGADLQEAYDFYKKYGPAPANRFLRAFEAAATFSNPAVSARGYNGVPWSTPPYRGRMNYEG
jgi:hypothetical protein